MLRAPHPIAGEPLSPELPARLRQSTHDLHTQTERSGLMADLLAGRITRPRYIALLFNLHALYAALEAALAHHQADLAIAMLQAGPLRRTAALAADLQSLQGAQWQQAFTLQSAMRDYVHRLQALAATGSRALVAHAYVRYLGDLNGGQALARLVVRRLDLVGAEGTRFYDFGTAEEVAARRTAFRAALGQLPLRAGEDDLIVEEARWAFRQHQRLFEELQSA
jgi:heme oxygenase